MLPNEAITKISNILEVLVEDYEIENDVTINNAKLREVTGVTNSDITRFRRGDSLLHLDSIIALVRFLSPEKEIDTMRDICNLALTTEKPYIIREAMEYTSQARLLNVLKTIIDDQLSKKNKENREFAKAYLLSYKFQSRATSYSDLLSEIEAFFPSRDTTKIFVKILKCIVLQYQREYSHMERIFRDVNEMINTDACQNAFLAQSYKVRLAELKSIVSLNVYSDFKSARYYAKKVIDSEICAKFKVHAYYTVGGSYLFDDYEACLSYYEQYRKLLLLDGRGDLAKIVKEQDMVFLKIVHGRELGTITTDDVSELAHMEARWGNKEKALQLVDEAVKQQGESVFKTYYRALAEKDAKKLYESLLVFINSGLKFYANLVRNDLKTFGGDWDFVAETTIKNLTSK